MLTALLTYHSGWISTCYKSLSIKQNISERNSYNALWYQLLDYDGSSGYNQKSSKIVVLSSTHKHNEIEDITQFLRYFIRFYRVQKRDVTRTFIEEDNEQVRLVLNNKKRRKSSAGTNKFNNFTVYPEHCGLNRTKTFTGNIAKLACLSDREESFKEDDPVIFILGDNERLINLKDDSNLDTFGDSDQEIEEWSSSDQGQLQMSNSKDMFSIPKMKCWDESSETKNKLEHSKINIISFPLPR